MSDPSQEVILGQIKEIIADSTANNAADISAETQLEYELGVTPVDFKRIVAEINRHFSLNLQAQQLLDDEISTAQELAVIVREEIVLG